MRRYGLTGTLIARIELDAGCGDGGHGGDGSGGGGGGGGGRDAGHRHGG